MSDLPTLSEYLRVVREKKDLSLPIYSVTLRDGMQRRETLGRSILSELESKDNLFAAQGDICYNMMRMWQGASGLAPEDCHVSPAYVVCRPRENLDPVYASYLLKSKEAIKEFIDRSQGVTSDRWRLYPEEFLKISLFIPPLPEQKKIAEILSGIDQLIRCTAKKIAKLKVARNALIQNLAKEGNQEWISIGEISDFVTSGSRGWSQYYSGKGARFVRIGNLSRHSIDLDPDPERWQLVEPPKGAEGERTRLHEHDILISITADLGICCIYASALGEAYINQHIALVRVDAEHKGYARQVAYYICSEHCQEQIRSMNDSGAKAGLNLDSIRKIQVPLIPGEKGSKFTQSIDSLQDAIKRNACQLQHLAKAKNALSSDLLSGRKRVSV